MACPCVPLQTCDTDVVTHSDDVDARRAEWVRRQQRLRRTRDLGLLLLALGVLLLAYVALLATG